MGQTMCYTCNGSPKGCERTRFGGCLYHDNKDTMIQFNDNPPSDECEVEKHHRHYTNGLFCGRRDKESGKPKSIGGSTAFRNGYRNGYELALTPEQLAEKERIKLARSILADYPEGTPHFCGVPVENFSNVELRKIIYRLIQQQS